jgi:hypothetical protein
MIQIFDECNHLIFNDFLIYERIKRFFLFFIYLIKENFQSLKYQSFFERIDLYSESQINHLEIIELDYFLKKLKNNKKYLHYRI